MAMLYGPRSSVLAARRSVASSARRLLVAPVQAAAAPKEPKVKVLKRAPSAFNLFYKAYYDNVRTKLESTGTKAGLMECNAELRALWSKLPDAQKVPFEQQAEEAKRQLAADRAAGLVPKTERVRAPKDKSGPPRPPSAYALFTKSEYAGFKAQYPDLGVAGIMKLIAAKWRSLPDAQKNKLLEQARAAFAAYKTGAPGAAVPAAPAAAPKSVPKAAAAPPGAARRTASPPVGARPTSGPPAPAGRVSPSAPGGRVSPPAGARPTSPAPPRVSPSAPARAPPRAGTAGGRAGSRTPTRTR